jgi:hypothetical protein
MKVIMREIIIMIRIVIAVNMMCGGIVSNCELFLKNHIAYKRGNSVFENLTINLNYSLNACLLMKISPCMADKL